MLSVKKDVTRAANEPIANHIVSNCAVVASIITKIASKATQIQSIIKTTILSLVVFKVNKIIYLTV
jgi:hypothetical protein